MPFQPLVTVDLRPDLSMTVIICCGALVNGPSKNATRLPSGNAQRPRSLSFMNGRTRGELDGPGAITPRIPYDGQRIRSGNPVGVHHAGEQVDACATGHRNPRQRSHTESVRDVLGTEHHRQVARPRHRHDSRILQLKVAGIGVPGRPRNTAYACPSQLALYTML
jgi:hypothetical protein